MLKPSLLALIGFAETAAVTATDRLESLRRAKADPTAQFKKLSLLFDTLGSFAPAKRAKRISGRNRRER